MRTDLLESVCNAPGVPGYEDVVQGIVIKELKESCDSVHRDHIGNVIGIKKATNAPDDGKPRLKLMIDAHCDEVSMLVTDITSRGTLKFRMMGGLNSIIAQSQRVHIHADTLVRGVVVPKISNDGKAAPLEELEIDTGLSKDEVEELVPMGSPVTFEHKAETLNGKVWVGRNFDNRIGGYCLLEAMRQVKNTAVDIYAVSSVQEEVGLRGARAAAGKLQPDMAIAIDHPISSRENKSKSLPVLGEGTGIYMLDKLTVGHPKLVKHLFKLCKDNKIPHQLNIGGGTNAAAIQQSPGSAIVTTVGAPVCYPHSTVQICHLDDIESTVALLVKFMESAYDFYHSLDYVDGEL
jgi:tetrahedral aminopeptidase